MMTYQELIADSEDALDKARRATDELKIQIEKLEAYGEDQDDTTQE